MTWTKIDDQLHAHPKVQQAWQTCDASLGLHLLALSYAGAYLTDGVVSEAFARVHMPSPAKRRKAIAALVDAGLWDALETGGWQIHDFLEFNPSREQIAADRDWDRKRKELHRDTELTGEIRARDGDACRYCSTPVNWKDRRSDRGGTYDHVNPRGDNTTENVVVACRSCNLKKGPRTPEQAGMPLLPAPNPDLALGSDPV